MKLTYRTRRRLQHLAIGVLILVLVAIMAWLVWIIWLDRYVVYSRDGAKLDFSLSNEDLSGEVAVRPTQGETVPIFYNDGEDAVNVSTELTQLVGYYADTEALRKSVSEVRRQIDTLPAGTAVMLDLKNISGYFHYSTKVGDGLSSSVDISAVDELISYLKNKNLYTIARIPAFQDYHYFMGGGGNRNLTHGLATSKGYLWVDNQRCYWLNPGSNGTITYLIQIIMELRDLGFDEVVLDGFQFPDTTAIAFKGDRAETLGTAAKTLVDACTTDSFTLSFTPSSASFVLPEGRCRMYLKNLDAGKIKDAVETAAMEDPMTYLVFVTETLDTRFNDYSVMRPLSSAHFDEEE